MYVRALSVPLAGGYSLYWSLHLPPQVCQHLHSLSVPSLAPATTTNLSGVLHKMKSLISA